jgi:hypothetical protein
VFYLTFEENAWWDIGYDGQERLVEPMNFLRPFFMDISPINVIERVVISCIYDRYRGMCQPTWDTFLELKNILAKDRFRSLHEVVFYARGMESRDIDEYLTPCVEGLRKQGINARMQFGACLIFTSSLKLDTRKNLSRLR